MFMNPELYQKCSMLPIRDARQCLKDYGKEIKWKKDGATVIDIGCGDGNVTSNILKTYIPNNCKELIGCDISEKMIEFAAAHYAKDFIRFTVLDIGGDLPGQFREKFDHAFSFYALNWIQDQKKVFSNIYNLLASKGDCLLTLVGNMPLLFDVWRGMARSPRWNYLLKDIDCFVSPYHDSQKCSMLPIRDARQCLKDYGKEIKWKKDGATVIDIGCGDGNVTSNILKSYLPDNFKELVGCDISEKMIEFATAHYAKDFIRFTVLDIGGDLPDQLREKFDHAFSFYALNWIQDQKKVFSNIYNLLASGGDCLLTLVGNMPLLFDVWRGMARSPRWNYLLKDIDCFVSPYHDSQDPEKDVEIMMTSIGFTDVKVKCLPKEFVYPEIEIFKKAMTVVNPFKIPLEMQEDFIEDFLKVFRGLQPVDDTCKYNVDGTLELKIKFKNITIYGKKQMN